MHLTTHDKEIIIDALIASINPRRDGAKVEEIATYIALIAMDAELSLNELEILLTKYRGYASERYAG